jgi:hypothetical protein
MALISLALGPRGEIDPASLRATDSRIAQARVDEFCQRQQLLQVAPAGIDVPRNDALDACGDGRVGLFKMGQQFRALQRLAVCPDRDLANAADVSPAAGAIIGFPLAS